MAFGDGLASDDGRKNAYGLQANYAPLNIVMK
jgi:hypothetical protein